ncbi:hypothetical protein Vadar_033866 [Vaccinium darrowii]|uniref:Uncharacterized protein n=1 Tax=Vaccinium darrowii TaxID=229202 RepID=A0ACB7Z7Y9_9ERIC|nr:hypothetical protein Vadar_033866 [Vaccinium darrowii]
MYNQAHGRDIDSGSGDSGSDSEDSEDMDYDDDEEYETKEIQNAENECVDEGGPSTNVVDDLGKWLAKKYVDQVHDDPDWKVTEMQSDVRRTWKLDVSEMQIYRAKRKALEIVDGVVYGEQYHRLWDYCLDACFFKGPFAGQLMHAVGRDGDNQMYSIAMAGLTESMDMLFPGVEHSCRVASAGLTRGVSGARARGVSGGRPRDNVAATGGRGRATTIIGARGRANSIVGGRGRASGILGGKGRASGLSGARGRTTRGGGLKATGGSKATCGSKAVAPGAATGAKIGTSTVQTGGAINGPPATAFSKLNGASTMPRGGRNVSWLSARGGGSQQGWKIARIGDGVFSSQVTSGTTKGRAQ